MLGGRGMLGVTGKGVNRLCERAATSSSAQLSSAQHRAKPQLNNDDYNDDIDDFNCSTSGTNVVG